MGSFWLIRVRDLLEWTDLGLNGDETIGSDEQAEHALPPGQKRQRAPAPIPAGALLFHGARPIEI